jgi:hypothetical protein
LYTTIDGIQGILDFIGSVPLTPYGFSYRYPVRWRMSESEQKKYGQLAIHPAARKAIELDLAHGFITLIPVTPP